MIIVLLVILGLVLGSFVNALVWRFHEQAELEDGKKKQLSKRQLSMTHGRSMCSSCHHELAPKDLVPLFSWLWLKGKCRYCRKPIKDTPLLELVLPITFVISYLFWPQTLNGVGLYDFVFWLLFLTAFAALTVYDLKWFLLPNRIVFPLIGLAVIQLLGRWLLFGFEPSMLLEAVWGIAIASGIFYLLFTVSNGKWIGGGDVKLGIIIGLLVGGPGKALLLLFIASLAGTLVALPLMAVGKTHMTSKLPFGPYLMLATFLVYLFGADAIQAYYGFINTLMV